MAKFKAVLSALAITAALLPMGEVWGQSGTTGSGTPQVPMSDGAGGTLNTNPANIITNGNPNTSTLPQKQMGSPSSVAVARTARRNNELPPPTDGSNEIDSQAAAKLAARPPAVKPASAPSASRPQAKRSVADKAAVQ